MTTALDVRNNFLTELDVRYVSGSWLSTHWRVLGEFTYRIGGPESLDHVRIPDGFITDFASIPVGVRLVFRSPGGCWDKPAVVHDYLYNLGGYWRRDKVFVPVTRAQADAIFNDAMKVTGTNGFARRAIYRGVRAGGMMAWRKHRKADGARAA